MKVQIRKSVFETNSSSTHSVQISGDNLEGVQEMIHERILKSYGDSYKDTDIFDPMEYLEHKDGKNILKLKGIKLVDGDEEKNAYTILLNWMAKIQYLYTFIRSYYAYFKEDKKYLVDYIKKYNIQDGELCRFWYDHPFELREFDENRPKIEHSQEMNAFIDVVKEYIKEKQHIIIDDVMFDFDFSYEKEYKNINFLDEKTRIFMIDKYIEYVKDILYNNKTIIYMDEAYSPYQMPEIKTI